MTAWAATISCGDAARNIIPENLSSRFDNRFPSSISIPAPRDRQHQPRVRYHFEEDVNGTHYSSRGDCGWTRIYTRKPRRMGIPDTEDVELGATDDQRPENRSCSCHEKTSVGTDEAISRHVNYFEKENRIASARDSPLNTSNDGSHEYALSSTPATSTGASPISPLAPDLGRTAFRRTHMSCKRSELPDDQQIAQVKQNQSYISRFAVAS